MKKIITGLVFFVGLLATAQTGQERISVRFSEIPVKEALLQIEEKTDYKFYFVEQWLPQRSISGNFEDSELRTILDELFANSLINYYFLEEKIILTKNNIIYDELPENFFGKPEEIVVEEQPEEAQEAINPIFYADEEAPAAREIETVYIGRAERTARSARFILSGIVTSAEDGQPIPNLAISVRNRDIGTVTNENGYYELRLPAGANIVETSSLGNEDVAKRVIIYNDGKLNYSLKEDFQQLGEVLLESDPDSNVSDAVTGAEEINVEEIKNIPLVLGERDILKVATTLPGISTAGEGAAGFNVRGGRADQNLILLDNAVIYNPSHFFGIFSALNPFTTGTVDIYKGNIPAQFGGRLSSVFDIQTKDANVEEFAGEASIGPVTGNLT